MFRCADGHTTDAETHRQTWETLRAVAERPDFLQVADSKPCAREVMDHPDRHGGRFVTATRARGSPQVRHGRRRRSAIP